MTARPARQRRRLSAAGRQLEILRNSAQLVAERGFKSVSVREIAARAQVNQALLYHYFPTKEALFHAIMDEIRRSGPRFEKKLPDSEEQLWSDLEEFVEFFAAVNQGKARALRVVLYAILEGYPLPIDFDFATEGSFLHWLELSLEKGKREWGFDPDLDSRLAVCMFMGTLMYSEIQTSLLHQGPLDTKKSVVEGARKWVRRNSPACVSGRAR